MRGVPIPGVQLMASPPEPPPARLPFAPEPAKAAVKLLRRAELSAVAAFVISLAVVGVFLWSINPTNLVYALTVVSQNWGLWGFALLALGLPAVTWAGARRIRQSGESGDWARIRPWLRPLIVTGYLSWIIPGYYLLETLNLLNRWRATEPVSLVARQAP